MSAKSQTDELVFVALGGVGEIGMNMYAYGFGQPGAREWIIVDCGLMFGNKYTTPGIDLILPDLEDFLALSEPLAGIFLTHAHEDHIGAIGHLWQELRAPIYATGFTSEIVRDKLEQAAVSGAKIRVCQPDEFVSAGVFSVKFFPVTHSIPGANALIIETSLGRVFHSGDFKFDPKPILGEITDIKALQELGKKRIDALLCDSTNILQPDRAGSEGELREPIANLIKSCKGAVAATSFASNITRLRTLAKAAVKVGREITVVGRSMRRMIDAATRSGELTDFPRTIAEEHADDIPPSQMFYLVTGSQGESRSALARIAGGTHPSVKLAEGDTVLFSSKNIPGNEREIISVINNLATRKVDVIDAEQSHIHVSGHAHTDELKQLCELLRPQTLVPIHGEHRHILRFAQLAREWGIGCAPLAPNGTMVRLLPGPGEIVGHLESGRIYLDGAVKVRYDDGVVRERVRLAHRGSLALSFVLDKDGHLLSDVKASLKGAPERTDEDLPLLTELVEQAAEGALTASRKRDLRTDRAVEELVSAAVRKCCQLYWGKKPVVSVLVMRVDR